MIGLLSPMLAVSCTEPVEPAVLAKAEKLAVQLNLPVELPENSYSSRAGSSKRYRLLLRVSSNGLELIKLDDPKLSGAVRVDFTAGHAAYRRKQQKKELLVRAVGGKGGNGGASLNVIDATGGLGRDSFLLAAAGHRVHIFERQPVVAALLADGLARAAAHPETAEICQRIRLTVGDAVPALEVMQKTGAGEKGEDCEGGEGVDVVYLDPMFPERRKSALVKKELQLLQLLAHLDSSPEKLLESALEAATRRVVVKRPLKAPFLTDRSPSHSLTGKTVRFDVYLGCLLSRNREYSG
ncbi:class I SAM-dependent methyltransferase [Desulfobulbus sp. US1]|nr:class I SAM-dependent methyltransferase [Desulfobulbus sp. US4]MCW5204952.1 class I SAM-dependent methyltransferase [Desulfobulbus sp. N2]MCW5207477.1 class I SAM-dependent methyltransferase [Desulfobulbus sp. US2]MCW5209013.1 class I SAM-dependent methyltransferase [Desulfobulbus sp. US1]